jgi:hypothetical protein
MELGEGGKGKESDRAHHSIYQGSNPLASQLQGHPDHTQSDWKKKDSQMSSRDQELVGRYLFLSPKKLTYAKMGTKLLNAWKNWS